MIDGHAIFEAAQQLGLNSIRCIILQDCSELERRALSIALNRLQERGEWDEQVLRLEYQYLLEANFDLTNVAAKLSTNNIMSLKHAALSGLGAAVLPRWFVASELASGDLIDLLPDWRAAMLDVNVAYLPARHQPRRLSAFIDALEEGFGNIPGIIV